MRSATKLDPTGTISQLGEAKALPGARYSRGFGLYAMGLGAAFLGGEASVGVRDGLSELAVILPMEAASAHRPG